uniref:Uncharacterized protein n=1 Tax=Heterosigma akashiwo TaxID=2829 RepID=A0A6V1V7V3_HETAK
MHYARTSDQLADIFFTKALNNAEVFERHHQHVLRHGLNIVVHDVFYLFLYACTGLGGGALSVSQQAHSYYYLLLLFVLLVLLLHHHHFFFFYYHHCCTNSLP